MIKVRKSNVVLQVTENEVQAYLNNGYDYAEAPKVEKKKVTIAPKVKDAEEVEETPVAEEKEVAPKVKGKK